MRRTLIPLLTVFALLLVAAGGAAAAGDAGTTSTAENATDGGDVGICLVGADSPCNGAPADGSANDTAAGDGDRLGEDTDSEDGRLWIPEDRDRDGEIDEEFQGDRGGNGTLHILPTHTDRPATHPTPTNDTTDIGTDDGQSGDDTQIWIPEDRNRDGEIDDRFTATVGPFADIVLPFLHAL